MLNGVIIEAGCALIWVTQAVNGSCYGVKIGVPR